MAREFSDHQKKIVNRYYQHQDTIRSEKLSDLVAELWLCEDPKQATKLWGRAQVALMRVGVDAQQVANVVNAKDVEGLAALVKQVDAGTPQEAAAPKVRHPSVADGRTIREMHEQKYAEAGTDSLDPANLRRAMNAFKKKLKNFRRDDESKLGGRYVSAGRSSGITAITPPREFPAAVWEELVRQGRLKKGGSGTYQMP
jgi:ribosomal protein S15P/S13E